MSDSSFESLSNLLPMSGYFDSCFLEYVIDVGVSPIIAIFVTFGIPDVSSSTIANVEI